MLFILTGDVQSGKTRWLERLVAELAADGVESRGVLAPGDGARTAVRRAFGLASLIDNEYH